MNRKTERLASRALWLAAGLVGLAAVALAADTLFFPRKPAPLALEEGAKAGAAQGEPSRPGRDLGTLAQKKMTRTVVKRIVAPPPPPRPPLPRLESLVRLAGIMDFGRGKEAVIESRAQGRSRNYKAGDAIAGTEAEVKEVADAVVVTYDGKRYKLTYQGAEEIPPDPVAGAAGEKGRSRP